MSDLLEYLYRKLDMLYISSFHTKLVQEDVLKEIKQISDKTFTLEAWNYLLNYMFEDEKKYLTIDEVRKQLEYRILESQN